MIDTTTIEGMLLKDEIELIFSNKESYYIHLHNASPGCYNYLIDRVTP